MFQVSKTKSYCESIVNYSGTDKFNLVESTKILEILFKVLHLLNLWKTNLLRN
jgi:hypothetical protein